MDMDTHVIQEIKDRYRQHHANRPFIIAIDGLGGAGKTTLAEQLKTAEDRAVIIHMDDHIVERKRRYHTGHEEWFEYYQLQWDAAYLKKSIFEKLHTHERQLCLPFYNKIEDSLTEKMINVPSESMVLIEGIFLLRDEWKAFYDFIIFLDCPQEVRCKRVLQRDTYIGDFKDRLKKYQHRYWPAEDYYIKKQKPIEAAHLVHRCR